MPPPLPPRASPDSPAVRQRILLVEDHAFIREELVLQLEAPDREVVGCASAEDALAQAARWRAEGAAADLLVTDLSLPGMTGIDLARALQALQPGLPIVLCTGYDLGAAAASLGPQVRCVRKDDVEGALAAAVEAALAAGRGA